MVTRHDPPIVDVLIPAFNAAATIESAIASIQRQTLGAIFIHIVDDGSTDETPAILERLVRDDPRIRVHRQANGGIVEALNYGLTKCAAEFIARHDADDIAYPERLETQLAYLRAHPEVVAVGAKARHIGPDGTPLGTIADLASPDLCDPETVPAREPYIIHPLLTVRREALLLAGGYRHVVHSEDSDLYWRLADQGGMANLPVVLADYRMHEGSISAASAANGRIMAVNSQLAAVSARRRRAGLADIDFPMQRVAKFKALDGLADMVDLASDGLTEAERVYLARASAAKFLELTSYRPYDLSDADARFVRATFGGRMVGIVAGQRRMLERRWSGAGARLAANGAWRRAFMLVPPRLWPGFLARVAMRRFVPRALHRIFQRSSTRIAIGQGASV